MPLSYCLCRFAADNGYRWMTYVASHALQPGRDPPCLQHVHGSMAVDSDAVSSIVVLRMSAFTSRHGHCGHRPLLLWGPRIIWIVDQGMTVRGPQSYRAWLRTKGEVSTHCPLGLLSFNLPDSPPDRHTAL